MPTRTKERVDFLDALLVTAIENFGYGWFTVHSYEPGGPDAYAVIEAEDEPGEHTVTLDTFAKGLGVIRNAVLKPDPSPYDGGELVLHNADTGERLYLSQAVKKDLMDADRSNGDEGDFDVVGALAVLECGLFGRVVYA